jgi:small-conductance mechanosensitive channel
MDNAYEIIRDKLSLWLKEIIRISPNVVLAALVLVLGLFLAKIIKNLIGKFSKKIIRNPTLNSLFTLLVYVISLGVTIFMVLSILKLDKAVTSILAGAGIIGLALAFVFQDIASNFMSGIFLSVRKPLHTRDIVKIKEYMGEVMEINLRDTVIKTFQGQMVIIPNKEVLQNPIENYSLLGKRRMDLHIGISYNEDLEKVKTVTMNAVTAIPGIINDEITMFYEAFGDSSINFVIRIWVNTAGQIEYLSVQSEAVMRIKKAFDKNGIIIPFPIRTLDFGTKGDVILNEIVSLKDQKQSKTISS